MEITVFSKKRQTKEGKVFFSYLGRLTRKSTGEVINVTLKFREDCGSPKPETCPRNIIVDKGKANLSTGTYADNDGNVFDTYTMWVSEWKDGGPYVDHSLDDFN